MRLFLLRHADAEAHANSDLERPLSEKGHRQAKDIAAFLKRLKTPPQIVLSSPALRAMQTAEPVAGALGVECVPCSWARPGMSAGDALYELPAYASFQEVLLVGHQPDLGMLAARLIGAPDPARIHVRKASLLQLTMTAPNGALLEALIPCHLM